MLRDLLLLFFLNFLVQFTTTAQSTFIGDNHDLPLRIEIPARSVNETYRIIPVGKTGLILFYRSNEMADPARSAWYFALYDTNLQQIWVKPIPLPTEHNLLLNNQCGDTLSLLFVPVGKSRSSDTRIEILRIIPSSGMLLLNAGNTDANSEIVDFGIRNDRAWIGINQNGKVGKILTIHLNDGFARTFPLGVGNVLALMYLKPDSASNTVTAVVSRQVSKKSAEYFVAGYDTTGKVIREVMIGTQTGDRIFNNVRVVSTETAAKLITGSYGQGVSKSSRKNESGAEATGLFSCNIGEGKQQTINYYNFLEFKNADSFIGEKDILNLKKKALKKNKSLKEYSLDFQIIMQESLTLNNRFIVTTEVYSPQYHSETFTDFDFYGRPYTNSYSVFDGYRFSNAIVSCFDQKGQLVWDNNLELRNLISMELTPNVVVFPTGNDLVLFYLSDGVIASKIIHENTVVEKTDFTPVDLMFPEDKLITETKGKVQKWYGNYFLTSGYQEIKNIARESGNKRLVFYLSKLQFEP
ncbi:MAG: hypothetical protein WCP32_00425 [Bacteroidota bacterium]